IPLGGYVKPLDKRDSQVGAHEAGQEFSQKPAWQRVIVYLAGPAANFVLAILLYWVILLQGQLSVPPVVGDVAERSPAAVAGLQYGDEIVALGGREVQTWQQFSMGMLRFVGDKDPVAVDVRDELGHERTVQLDISAWSNDLEGPMFELLGFAPRPLPAVLGKINPDGAAAQTSLKEGDRIQAVNGRAVSTWNEWVQTVQAAPGSALELEVLRAGTTHYITLTPEEKTVNGERIGRVGVQIGGLRNIDYGLVDALPAALKRTTDQVTMILSYFGKMITGNLSGKNLGGPITNAQAAGETEAIGFISFGLLLAFFSVSLGVINLLPIPMLDGGWVMFGLIEMVRGKPLSDEFLMRAQGLGMTLVF